MVAIAGIIGIFVHAVRLWFVSRSASDSPVSAGRRQFLFAFLVPALNEARH